MKTWLKILLLFILPTLALISYPPATIVSGWVAMLLVLVMVVLLGMRILRGGSLALTFTILLQGMNVIVRMMMFFNNTLPKNGTVDYVYLITNLLGMVVSFYLVMRLDRVDIRSMLRS
jgi:hypothetical protein